MLAVLSAGGTGCKLVSLVGTSESSEGRSDDGAVDESTYASDTDEGEDEGQSGVDDGWDDADDED